MINHRARGLNLCGLLFGLAGVIILFRYGMPFHVPTGGFVTLAIDQMNRADIALEHRYTVYGYIGLACLIFGASLQILALYAKDHARR